MEIKMKRPVKCLLCRRQMYYVGEPKHEPEICLTLDSINIKNLEIGGGENLLCPPEMLEKIKN